MDEENRQYKEKIKNGAEKLSEAAKGKAKKEAMKKIISVIGIKGIAIIVLIVLASSLLGLVFLAGAVCFNDLDTKDKATSAKEAAIGDDALDKILYVEDEDAKYKINYDGKTGKEAIEAILEDNNMNFEDFTDEEIECLYKCLKAEWATTYPNLGEIVDNKDIDSEYVQGVITIRRGKSGGNIATLKYKPYDEFSTIKDENALDYFSMKDGNIIVANWSSNKTTYKPSDSMPEDIKNQYTDTEEQISITETAINYRSMIGIHTIPFELLLSLLINTEKVDFVSELADLAFNSTIEITVYDNVKQITTVTTEHTNETTSYKKWVDYTTTTTTQEILSDGTISRGGSLYGGEEDKEITSTEKKEVEYTLTTERITKTNSYVVGLTNVSSWLADIKNEYIYNPQYGSEEDLGLGSPNTYTQEQEKEDISTTDSEVIAFKKINESTSTKVDSYNNSTQTTTKTCKINEARKQGTLTGLYELTKNTSKTDEYKYESGTKETSNIGKNFKEVYDKNPGAQAQLDCVSSWLFEMLEETESTVDYVSVMKYLLFVCTGNSYGVTEEYIIDIFETKSFITIENISVSANEKKVNYNGQTITYSGKFATETKSPDELGINYTIQTGVKTTNYDACRVCNEYKADTIPTTAIGITLDDFPKVVAKWTGGSFVEYGDWVYIDNWGYALVADCGGFTGKQSDYFHLDCFVGQEGDILDDGKGDYSALKRRCINWEGVYNRQPGNRENETIKVIKAKDAEKYINENYKVASTEKVSEMLEFGAQALGKKLAGAKKLGIISSCFSNYNDAWCSVYAFSLYEKAGFISSSASSGAASTSYWQLMDGSKYYNGYFAGNLNKEIGDVNYLPKPGDLIFYKFSSEVQYSSHVGVVYEITGNTMKTIEGNTSDGNTSNICAKKERDYCKPGTRYSWGTILGYFSLESFLNSK